MELRYQNRICLVATMHEKQKAIKSSFESILGCKVVPANINTDLLGTFTGEIERKLPPHLCVKEKCNRALATENIDLCIANEGSFGPHPIIPFSVADHEIIFFIDRKLNFELSIHKIFNDTNFNSDTVSNIEELIVFAEKSLFPSHGLIIRPNIGKFTNNIHKGIQNLEDLKTAFEDCRKLSIDKKVRAETDMRAHMNPTRMKMIADLSQELAYRLTKSCPACQTPGWGIIKKQIGLECRSCKTPTNLVQSEIYGCCKCTHHEVVRLEIEPADPQYCPLCNP